MFVIWFQKGCVMTEERAGEREMLQFQWEFNCPENTLILNPLIKLLYQKDLIESS